MNARQVTEVLCLKLACALVNSRLHAIHGIIGLGPSGIGCLIGRAQSIFGLVLDGLNSSLGFRSSLIGGRRACDLASSTAESALAATSSDPLVTSSTLDLVASTAPPTLVFACSTRGVAFSFAASTPLLAVLTAESTTGAAFACTSLAVDVAALVADPNAPLTLSRNLFKPILKPPHWSDASTRNLRGRRNCHAFDD